MLDLSASMEASLETSRQAALRFLERAIDPRDRAAIVTFNDRPTLAVKLTNDKAGLAAGLAGLKAERGTALLRRRAVGWVKMRAPARPERASGQTRTCIPAR